MEYSLKHIALICNGRFSGTDVTVDSVLADSRRSTAPGERPIFMAVKGSNFDGHAFIDDLYRRGIRAFLVSGQINIEKYPLAGFVTVEKPIAALQKLAADYRASFRGTMVAITGSSGKTTVKEWIARLAPEGMNLFRSPRSYNSQLGVPLSVLMIRDGVDIALIEAGISRPGEMERLSGIIEPEIGIITNIGPEHDENFDSTEQKIYEKIKLFATCRRIVYNGSNGMLRQILEKKIPTAQLIDAGEYLNDTAAYFTDEPSRENAALAVAFFVSLGIDKKVITDRLGILTPVGTRLDITEGIGGSLIVTDKNVPDVDSLPIALDYLREVAAGKQTTVIMSDIPFSSTSGAELYDRVAHAISTAGIGSFIGIGERLRHHAGLFGSGTEFHPSADDFLKRFSQDKIAGHAVLIEMNQGADLHRVVHALERRSHTTVLEIDLDAMIGNYRYFRSLLQPSTKIMAMIKASGYGNGNYEVANMLQRQGADYLAVAFADEGVKLREQGITMPIVVLNADSESFGLMVAHRLEPEIYNFTSLRSFLAVVRETSEIGYPIHIKLDTGMHRLGFLEGEIPELTDILQRETPAVVVRSVFSHLAASDEPRHDEFTREQIERFRRISEVIISALPYRPLLHIANSAGIERFPEAEFDMCRLGIGLYGVSGGNRQEVKPVSRLVTRVVQVKELGAGETVGYGRTGVVTGPSRLATIPIGYADGLDRRLGEGRWQMRTGEKEVPTFGRISMDSCVIDVTGLNVSEGDEVVVFGSAPGNTVEDMAAVLGTIPYEIMTSVSERVKRIYIKD